MEEREHIDFEEYEEVRRRYTEICINTQSYEWHKIRVGDYWEKRDALPSDYHRMLFTIERVEQYERREGLR